MTNLQKNVIFYLGSVAILALILFLLSNINHPRDTATTTNTVSFSGEGKVLAKPDIAVISFAVVTEATTSKVAQDANSQKSQKITDFLKKQGIEDKDIKTSSYNVYPQYGYPRPLLRQGSEGSTVPMPLGANGMPVPPESSSAGTGQSYPQYYDSNPKITGYQVNQSFEVKVRNLDKVSGILDGLVSAGANQVNNLGFQIDEPDKLKSEARALAIADAKKKADDLKNQLGIRLGRIVNFSENSGGWPGPIYMMEAKTADGRGSGPSLPTGENEITINVTITYQIK